MLKLLIKKDVGSYDIIHSHSFTSFQALLGMMLGIFRMKRVVSSPAGQDLWAETFGKFIIASVDTVIAESRHVKTLFT